MDIKPSPKEMQPEVVVALKEINNSLSVAVALKAINENLSKLVDLFETHVQASQTRNKILDEKLEEIAQEVAVLNSTVERKQGD